MSMKNVLDPLALYKKSPNTYPQAGLIKDVKERGLCVAPTPAEIERIREAGASQELIDAIVPPAPSPPQPVSRPTLTPAPKKEGHLRVLCQPVDCKVMNGDKPLGVTKNNEFVSDPLPVGPIALTVSQQDYDVEPKFPEVIIKENETATVSIKLTVSREALLREGKKQFSDMITALGGEEGLKALSFFKAKGILQSYDRTGQETDWDVEAILKSPDLARFEVNRRGKRDKKDKFLAFNVEHRLDWQNQEKKPSPQWDELDQALRRVQEHQLARLLERFRSDGFKIIASDLVVKPGDETVVKAEGSGETYSIRIGADHRPREIVYEGTLVDKGLRVLFSEYADQNGASFPMTMQLQFPDAERHALALKLGAVELNPAGVKDSGLRPPPNKKKR